MTVSPVARSTAEVVEVCVRSSSVRIEPLSTIEVLSLHHTIHTISQYTDYSHYSHDTHYTHYTHLSMMEVLLIIFSLVVVLLLEPVENCWVAAVRLMARFRFTLAVGRYVEVRLYRVIYM